MRTVRIAAALVLAAAAGAANAGVSSTWTLASDYDYRGITQTAQDPAVQASIDYVHDSGWYLGAWGSNVDLGDLDVDYEIDVYSGFTGKTAGEIGWDVGLLYYTYHDDSDLNFVEVYGALSYSWFKGKLSYSNDFGGDSTSGNTPAWYFDGSATVPLPANFSALAHVGYSFGDYWDDLKQVDAGRPYIDYSLGVGYALGRFNLALKWIDGSDFRQADGTSRDVLSTEPRLVFSFATAFPWSE